MNEATRPAARVKLDQLRSQHAAQTAANLAAHDLEWRKRDDLLEQQKIDKARAIQERRDAEQRAAEAVAQQRLALQQGIQAGTTTVSLARADLRATAMAAAEQQQSAAPPQAMMPPPAPGLAAYVPAAPTGPNAGGAAQPAMVQPVDAASAAAKAKEHPSFMLSSLKASAEEYEADIALLKRVRLAAGYDADVWRRRYRAEAFCARGLHFRAAGGGAT